MVCHQRNDSGTHKESAPQGSRQGRSSSRAALAHHAQDSQRWGINRGRNIMAQLGSNLSGAIWTLLAVLLCNLDTKRQARWRSHVSGKFHLQSRETTSFVKLEGKQPKLVVSFAGRCSVTIQPELSIIRP